MSNFLLDTSVVVPYYVPEALSEPVEDFLSSTSQPAMSQLVKVEFYSAIARRVRMLELSQQDAQRIGNQFEQHLTQGLYRQMTLETAAFDLATAWLRSTS